MSDHHKPKRYSYLIWFIFILTSIAFAMSSIWYEVPSTPLEQKVESPSQ